MAQRHPKGLLVLALANMGERFGYVSPSCWEHYS